MRPRALPALVVVAHDRVAMPAVEPVVAAVEELAPGGRGPPGGGAVAARDRRLLRRRGAAPSGCGARRAPCGVEIQAGVATGVRRLLAAGPAHLPAGPRPRSSPTGHRDPGPSGPGRPAAPPRRTDARRLRGAARRRRDGPVRLRRRVRAPPRQRGGRAAPRGAPAPARPGGRRRVRPAAGTGGHGRLRRPGAGRPAPRAVDRARGGGHPARHRGLTWGRRGLHRCGGTTGSLPTAPGALSDRVRVATRRLAHPPPGEGRAPRRRGSTGSGCVPTASCRYAGCRPACGRGRVPRAGPPGLFVRVQGLLGPDYWSFTPVLGGAAGTPTDPVVPWGDERTPDRPAQPPWPGRLPSPAPATVPSSRRPPPYGRPTARRSPSTPGSRCRRVPPGTIGRESPSDLTGGRAVAAEERWWAPGRRNRTVRLQLGLPTAGPCWSRCATGE